MFRSIAGVSVALVLALPLTPASAQTPKYKLLKINVANPSSPYTVHVGDVVQLNLTNQNVGGLPTSTVVAGSGNALSQVGTIVLDTTTTPSTYVTFYSVVSLGGSTVQFHYSDTSGSSPKQVTQTIVFDVPAYGAGTVVDVNGNTTSPTPLSLKVGDVLRLTYRAASPTQTITSGPPPGSTVLKPGGATFDGTTYTAFFSGNQPGSTTLVINPGTGGGTIFQVVVSPPDPAP